MNKSTTAATQVVYRTRFLPLLALLFIGLKLTGYIAWSWWWVLAPLWAPLALVAGIFGVAFIIIGIAALISAILGK